jgi:hypothetical protein
VIVDCFVVRWAYLFSCDAGWDRATLCVKGTGTVGSAVLLGSAV